MKGTKAYRVLPQDGLVLLNRSLQVVACDRGAATILNLQRPAYANAEIDSGVTGELLDKLRNHDAGDTSTWKMRFRVETTDYVCRSFPLESRNGQFEQPTLALHFEKVWPDDEAIVKIMARYSLTEREQQTLHCILNGLTIKEVADQMSISPNTVKAFLRLVMIKFGVTTRWGIIAKIMADRDGAGDTQQSAPSPAPQHGLYRL
jgi:DNA-binding CsgD family transcriptional regulator